MASQGRRTRIGQSRWPKQALALFVLLLAIVYALIFFLPDRSPIPKLGIDLQGGTRVTLVPQGERPSLLRLGRFWKTASTAWVCPAPVWSLMVTRW